jgi:hypothetical protein
MTMMDESIQQFTLSVLELLIKGLPIIIPVVLALINQNRRIVLLVAKNEKLMSQYEELRKRFDKLRQDHEILQSRYVEKLELSAGQREKF